MDSQIFFGNKSVDISNMLVTKGQECVCQCPNCDDIRPGAHEPHKDKSIDHDANNLSFEFSEYAGPYTARDHNRNNQNKVRSSKTNLYQQAKQLYYDSNSPSRERLQKQNIQYNKEKVRFATGPAGPLLSRCSDENGNFQIESQVYSNGIDSQV